MSKNVQIPSKLFFELYKFHCRDSDVDHDYIRKEMEKKLDSLVTREIYTRYKTATTEEEKELARVEYLDRVGIPLSFRY